MVNYYRYILFLILPHKHAFISVWGVAYSFGIFLNGLMETFTTSYSSTSIISSVQMGVSLSVGPIAASLVKKFGCRKITILGSTVAATGLIISGFARNIATLYISAGFCTGNL